MSKLICVGCGQEIMHDWDGSALCYTHSCGATVFRTEIHMVFPASFIRLMADFKDGKLPVKDKMPHIDYYVGKSDYTDKTKETVVRFLQDIGCIWMKECESCKVKVGAR